MSNSLSERKGIGLNPISQIHYIDHLAVICVIMRIPLLFLDENDYNIGLKYYPGLKAIFEDYQNFNSDYVIKNWDVLFMSDLWGKEAMHRKFYELEKKYQKKIRSVHVPHGFSDKGFYLAKCVDEDILLVYGQNMLDMFKEFGVLELLECYVITGNYRYSYYAKNKEFYDAIVKEEILDKFINPGKIILYAPTWLDSEESTSFFEAYSPILDNVPKGYNLIVKLHPRLELDDAALFYHVIGRYQDKPNILFLKDYPIVFPLLACTDIYIGDMSSIGYDFLAFNRPMFFLNQKKVDPAKDRRGFLFQCGITIDPEYYRNLYSIIEQNLEKDKERFQAVRQEVWDYTFGKERSFKDIRSDIIAAYSTSDE